MNELLQELAKRFDYHGENIYNSPFTGNSSPLYAHLALQVANDPEILTLLVDIDRTTTITNLFLGAVHFLLLNGSLHPLADFYPSLTPNPRPASDIYPHFRAFCFENRSAIHKLITTRKVQTNEVRRCTSLLPVFTLVANRTQKPLAIIEVGTSAGLHALWDRYGYNYGVGSIVGDSNSPLQLTCEIRGDLRLPLPTTLPEVVYRVGIELDPIDVRDDLAVRWLRALIWPEHHDRVELLEKAVEVARSNPPHIIQGDAAECLTEILPQVPEDVALCVYHSYVVYQIPRQIREGIFARIAEHALQRDLFHISLEWLGRNAYPQLELFSYQNGQQQHELLAYCESHGRWIEWL